MYRFWVHSSTTRDGDSSKGNRAAADLCSLFLQQELRPSLEATCPSSSPPVSAPGVSPLTPAQPPSPSALPDASHAHPLLQCQCTSYSKTLPALVSCHWTQWDLLTMHSWSPSVASSCPCPVSTLSHIAHRLCHLSGPMYHTLPRLPCFPSAHLVWAPVSGPLHQRFS